MKPIIEKLLREFIERDFTLKEMAIVMQDISDYEEAKENVNNPERWFMRAHDAEWLETCRNLLANSLEWNSLQDYIPELCIK